MTHIGTPTFFQQKEDPVFEEYEKIKATEERLKAELRSEFYISTLTTPNDLEMTFLIKSTLALSNRLCRSFKIANRSLKLS